MMRASDGASRRLRRSLHAAIILLVALPPQLSLLASGKEGSAAIAGGLSISTDPDGASVYVDGRFAGHSPVDVKSVAAGDHRVRIVKNGYLENARVVTVAAKQPKVVQIRLTRDARAAVDGAQLAPPVPATTKSSGGGGGSLLKNKWLWLGVAGAGAGAAAFVLTQNHPPTAGNVAVTPGGTGMAGITNYTFTAQGASDPDGDSLTYNWNFGDGSTGTGASPTHTFGAPGTFAVTLSVSDGKKSATAPNGSVTVGQNLTANWTGGRENQFGCNINVALTQSGGSVSGTMTFGGGCTGSVSGVTGTVNPTTHPATVNWESPGYSFTSGTSTFANLVMSFSGTTQNNGATITGTLRLRQTSSAFDQSYSGQTFTR